MLLNCHVVPSELPTLQRALTQLRTSNAHPNFRLWLTADADSVLPHSLVNACTPIFCDEPCSLGLLLKSTLMTSKSFEKAHAAQDLIRYVHIVPRVVFNRNDNHGLGGSITCFCT